MGAGRASFLEVVVRLLDNVEVVILIVEVLLMVLLPVEGDMEVLVEADVEALLEVLPGGVVAFALTMRKADVEVLLEILLVALLVEANGRVLALMRAEDGALADVDDGVGPGITAE